MEMDLGPFMAAMIENAGGEIKVPMDAFASVQQTQKAITIDLEDSGATIVFRLTDEVPDDLEDGE